MRIRAFVPASRPIRRANLREKGMEDTPPDSPLVLRPNRLKFAALALGGLVFSALAFSMSESEPLMRYGGGAFFLLCAVIGAAQLLPDRNVLLIDAEGFEVRQALKRTRRTQFADVAEKGFFLWSHSAVAPLRINAVVWLNREGAKPQSLLAPLNRMVSGGDGYLPVSYGGYSAEAMADLLNARLEAWRRKAA